MATRFGSIVGRVLGPGGAPVSGATVAAVGSLQPGRDIAAITSADGTFRFGSMRPGAYHVEARGRGGSMRSADVVVAPGSPAAVEIRLDDAAPDEMLRPTIIVAPDDRVRVTKNAEYPWRCICELRILARDGSRSTGTGWLVAPRVVVTAGQCVYRQDAGGWAAQVEVIPGRNGALRPFGSAVSSELRSVPEWTDHHDFEYDYGAILLPSDYRFGDALGWFGYTPRDDAYLREATLNIAGYPGEGGNGRDAEEGTQWFSHGIASQLDERRLSYGISTTSGQRGSPVWEMTPNGERYGVAIHSGGTRLGNGGTRITRPVYDQIARWVGQAP